MGTRWSLGPVFDTEMKISSRRWQVYAGRALFVAALLIGMGSIWWSYLDAKWSVGLQNQAKIGEAYFYAMVGVQLALTMIVAPAATAGAVCVERSRGSLAHMLVTDLTPGRSSWASSWPGCCRSSPWSPAPGRSRHWGRSWAASTRMT